MQNQKIGHYGPTVTSLDNSDQPGLSSALDKPALAMTAGTVLHSISIERQPLEAGREPDPWNTMLLRDMLRANAREHLTIYILASLANVLLSIPQYLAVNKALELGINPKGTTSSLITQYGSSTGLALDFLRSGLIFQGVMAILLIGVVGSILSRRKWRWQYVVTSILVSAYLAYHLGGKFLNALGWIGVLAMSGVDTSGVYGDLFWFGLGTTICYLLVILVLRRSYGKLATGVRADTLRKDSEPSE